MASSDTELSTERGWTGKPIFSRFTTDNLECRTVAAAELYKEGHFKSITAPAKEVRVPYKRLYYRIQGTHPVRENGGNRTLLSKPEEKEVLCWAHRRITQGHHIQRVARRRHHVKTKSLIQQR